MRFNFTKANFLSLFCLGRLGFRLFSEDFVLQTAKDDIDKVLRIAADAGFRQNFANGADVDVGTILQGFPDGLFQLGGVATDAVLHNIGITDRSRTWTGSQLVCQRLQP